jgi:hypothetical protein
MAIVAARRNRPMSLAGRSSSMGVQLELLGERTGRVKDAVQPGRRITTLRTCDLGTSVRTALMAPAPPRG